MTFTPISTAVTRTCIRLLKQRHAQGGDSHAVRVYVQCIYELRYMARLSIEDAARVVKRDAPETAMVVMDRIGLYPSSEPELSALQRVWP
jgi:hypothetical protein